MRNKKQVGFKIVSLQAIIIFFLTGCRTNHASSDDLTAQNIPRIHSIGSTAILNFEAGQDLNIPIEGQNLRDQASKISVSVESPVPMALGKNYYLNMTNEGTSASLIFLTIDKSVTAELKSKDYLRVNVAISENHFPDASVTAAYNLSALPSNIANSFTPEQMKEMQNGQMTSDLARQLGANAALGKTDANRKLAIENWLDGQDPSDHSYKIAFDAGYSEAQTFAISVPKQVPHSVPDSILSSDSRTFILFTPEDYRSQILANQIEIQNITAFPLPYSEAGKLFGDLVANNFYAVRLTLLNPSTQDQIVSLGLIKAYGRALIRPKTKYSDLSTIFTKPIEVAPQSQQQVYTMVQSPKGSLVDVLDDSSNLGTSLTPNWDAVRDWVFGTLEFGGAMAAAYGTGFGASEDYLKAVALATGAAIPGLDKLWADKRPFYLLNIVNFAMPDLVKIPRGGSLDGKYIFFSKGQLQAVLQDPHLKQEEKKFRYTDQFGARVVYLEFDTLQIPFENTIPASGSTNLASEVELLQSSAKATLAEYEKKKPSWVLENGGTTVSGNGAFDDLTGTKFNDLETALKEAISKTMNLTLPTGADVSGLTNMLNIIRTNTDLLNPVSVSSNLWDSPNYGRSNLTMCSNVLQNVETGMLQGQPDSLFQTTVDSASSTVNSAQQLLTYYKSIAKIIQNDSLIASVKAVSASINAIGKSPPNAAQVNSNTNGLNETVQQLLELKPPIVK